jgi:hypothetical protein
LNELGICRIGPLITQNRLKQKWVMDCWKQRDNPRKRLARHARGGQNIGFLAEKASKWTKIVIPHRNQSVNILDNYLKFLLIVSGKSLAWVLLNCIQG